MGCPCQNEIRLKFMKHFWLLAALPGAALAQNPLALREAVDEALRIHPLLAAGSQRIVASEALRRQASLIPNPRMMMQMENVRPYFDPPFKHWTDTDNFILLQQPFETAGKRDRRTDLAGAGLRRSELERELLARQIGGRVKLAYWQAAGARQTYDLLIENGRNFQRIVEYHEIRVKEGAMAEVDLLRVKLERERIATAANGALLDAQRARIHLLREMGRLDFSDVILADGLDDPAPPRLEPASDDAVEQRTEVRLAHHAIETARAQLRLQQSLAKPNLDLIMGYKRTLGLDTVVGGVQFDLPAFNRNQGNIGAAAAEIRLAEANASAARALVKAEINAARTDIEIRWRQLVESLRPMLDQAAESSRIAEAAYREGGADLLRLLDAERVRLDARIAYVQTLTAYRQSIVGLEIALGLNP